MVGVEWWWVGGFSRVGMSVNRVGMKFYRRSWGFGRILIELFFWVFRLGIRCFLFESRCIVRRSFRGWGCCWSG